MSCWLVFPGQGAQKPGMLHGLADEPLVRESIAEASAVLGEDVMQLDSAAALASTRAVQLCLLVAGVACARLLLQQAPAPAYVAGLSIGAYPAAVVAGALSFADALKLVSLRAELMQQAWPYGYGMTALIGLEPARVEALLAQVHSAATPVYLANINADNQVVIAGSDAAMADVVDRARSAGVVVGKRLAVSVPSHCPLLESAARLLAAAFEQVNVRAPQLGYLSSSRARPLYSGESIRDELAFNMCRIVDWRATLQGAYERGVRLQIELPPGQVITGLARRVFSQGTTLCFEGTRLDTLVSLMQREGLRHL